MFRRATAIGGLAGAGTAAQAQEGPSVAIHGFRGWAYGKAMRSVSLTGSATLGTRWSISYDLYGGGVDQQEFVLPELFLRGEPVSATNEFELASTRDVVGAHVVVETPVPGLRVGGSGVTGTEIIDVNRRKVFGLQAKSLRVPWSF